MSRRARRAIAPIYYRGDPCAANDKATAAMSRHLSYDLQRMRRCVEGEHQSGRKEIMVTTDLMLEILDRAIGKS